MNNLDKEIVKILINKIIELQENQIIINITEPNITQLKEDIDKHINRNPSLLEIIEKLNKDVDFHKNRSERAWAKFKDSKLKIKDLKFKIKQLELKSESLSDNFYDNEEISSLKESIKTLQYENSELKKQYDTLSGIRYNLLKDVELYQSRSRENWEDLKMLKNKYGQLKKEYELLKELNIISKDIKQLQNEKKSLLSEIDNLKSEISDRSIYLKPYDSEKIRITNETNLITSENSSIFNSIAYHNGMYNNLLFINGKARHIKDWASIKNIPTKSIIERYKNGLRGHTIISNERNSSTLFKNDNICVNGLIHSASEWSNIIGNISPTTISKNIKNGYTGLDIFIKEGLPYKEVEIAYNNYIASLDTEDTIDIARFIKITESDSRDIFNELTHFIKNKNVIPWSDIYRLWGKLISYKIISIKKDDFQLTRLGELLCIYKSVIY